MPVNIYAITDSHQEARNLSQLLSGVYDFENLNEKPFLLLDCGDLFKGIYAPELSVNAYLKIKQLLPQAKIILTLGNNDFGFNQKNYSYLKSAIEQFQQAGIDLVCANLQGENLVPRYKIININNKKILITGFCLNTSVVKRFGIEFSDSKQALVELLGNVKENYDNIIILNHHWYQYSRDLYEFGKSHGIKIDLIIGGHEHSPIVPDYERNIFYPLAFARTLYKMKLSDKIENVEQIPLEKFAINRNFATPLIKYEQETKLFTPIAQRVLNLWKRYSEPCPLGTFISDNMKLVAKTQIAFHSTGFTMYPLRSEDSEVITKYDFEKVICASTPIVKMELTIAELKKIFENATVRRMYKNNGNSRFLQCSQNITITGKGNEVDKTYQIKQITIDKENLLDENAQPINNERKFTCAVDEFIANGEQGFDVLKGIAREPVIVEGEKIQLNKLLLASLKAAEKIYLPKTDYPIFGFVDL